MSPPRLKKRKVQEIWLDVLPANVRELIAEFATSGRQTSTALLLSEVSEVQRQAVLRALRCKFTAEKRDGLRWAQLFFDEIREISIPIMDVLFPEFLVSLLHCPTLRVAKVPGKALYLDSLNFGSSIEELTVSLVEEDHVEVLHSLRTLRLKKLHLSCSEMHPWACVKGLFKHYGNDVLSSCCPDLKALQISCRCGPELELHSVLSTFRSLREVTLNTPASFNCVPALKNLDSVIMLEDASGFAKYAPLLGSSLSRLEHAQPTISHRDDLLPLKSCKRLSYLSLHIEPGIETHLPALVPFLPQLRCLYLQWPNIRRAYYRPIAGMIEKIVLGAPQLEELGLICVSIAFDELKIILRHLGSQLTRFKTSVREQMEPAYERLTDVMHTLSLHNRSLVSFNVFDLWLPRRRKVNAEFHTRLRRLHCAKKILLGHAPLINEKALDAAVHDALRPRLVSSTTP